MQININYFYYFFNGFEKDIMVPLHVRSRRTFLYLVKHKMFLFQGLCIRSFHCLLIHTSYLPPTLISCFQYNLRTIRRYTHTYTNTHIHKHTQNAVTEIHFSPKIMFLLQGKSIEFLITV